MAALTWRNVDAPSNASAFDMIGRAQKQQQDALSGLDGVFKKYQDNQDANYTQGGVNNAETLRAMLYGAKTPEAMKALQDSGEYERMRAGFGANIKDADKITALAEGRLGNLQQQAVASQQFADQQVDVTGRPIAAGYQSALAQATTPDAVKSLMESIQTATGAGVVDPRLATTLTEKALGRSQTLVTEDRATQKFGFDLAQEADRKLMAPLDREAKQAAINASGEAARTSRATRSELGLTKLGGSISSQLVNGYRTHNTERAGAYAAIAAEFKIPVNPETGEIMPSVQTGQTEEVMKRFQAEIDKRIGPSITPSQVLETLASQLAKTGMSPAKVNAELKAAGENLTDVNMMSPSDQAKKKAFEEKQVADKANQLKNNAWYGADIDRPSEIQAVLKSANATKDWTLRDIPGNLNEYMTKGFPMPDGERIVIPPKVMQKVIELGGGVQMDTNFYNDTLANTEGALSEMLSDPKTLQLIRDAKDFDGAQRQAQGEFVRGMKLPATARTQIKNIDDYWKNALDKANSPK